MLSWHRGISTNFICFSIRSFRKTNWKILLLSTGWSSDRKSGSRSFPDGRGMTSTKCPSPKALPVDTGHSTYSLLANFCLQCLIAFSVAVFHASHVFAYRNLPPRRSQASSIDPSSAISKANLILWSGKVTIHFLERLYYGSSKICSCCKSVAIRIKRNGNTGLNGHLHP